MPAGRNDAYRHDRARHDVRRDRAGARTGADAEGRQPRGQARQRALQDRLGRDARGMLGRRGAGVPGRHRRTTPSSRSPTTRSAAPKWAGTTSQKAIEAYTKCSELYVRLGGEQFTNQHGSQAASRGSDPRIPDGDPATRSNRAVANGATQTQQLYVRELNTQMTTPAAGQGPQRERVDRRRPVPYFVPMALGAAYFRAGQFADAEREYKAAIEANPDSGETHNNLAVLYLTTDRVSTMAEQEVARRRRRASRSIPGLKDDIKKRRQ